MKVSEQEVLNPSLNFQKKTQSIIDSLKSESQGISSLEVPKFMIGKGLGRTEFEKWVFLDLLCALSTSELSYARNLLCFSNFNGFSILVRRGNVVLLYFLFQYCTPKLIIVLCFFVVFTHLHLLFSLSQSPWKIWIYPIK